MISIAINIKMKLIQEAEKWLMLETMDNAWKQHMLNLDHLKEGMICEAGDKKIR